MRRVANPPAMHPAAPSCVPAHPAPSPANPDDVDPVPPPELAPPSEAAQSARPPLRQHFLAALPSGEDRTIARPDSLDDPPVGTSGVSTGCVSVQHLHSPFAVDSVNAEARLVRPPFVVVDQGPV